jgi:hypothetical protein
MYKILSGVVIAVLILFGSDTKAAVYNISPGGDTWVYNVTPDAILGNDAGLATDRQNYSPKGFVFLKFNIPAFPNEFIQSATLHLYQYDGAGYGEGPTALVLIGDDNWSESTLTWNNAPNGPNYLFPLLSTSADGRSHRGWSSWSFPWDFSYGNTITLRLGENSSGDQVHVYYSSEYYGVFPGIESGLEPYLEIVTVPNPFGVATGLFHTLGIKSDGTVVAAGLNEDGQCNVGDWDLLVGFADVPPEYWAYDYIMAIYGAQITTGCSTDPLEYCPDSSVTREQMAVFIVRALNQVPEDGYCGSTPPFSDVSADRWSCKYVKRLVEMGITSGVGEGLFGPEGTVTREQMAAFLTRALDEVPADGYCGTEGPFTDVPYSLWSCKYVKRLVELGITAGIGEGLYGPGNPLTRGQMAVFLARAFLGM